MSELLAATAAPKGRPTSLWRSAVMGALLGVGGLGASAPALAANANFTVSVTPVPTDASVGRGSGPDALTTYAAYKIDIANVVGNTTNAIRFTGSTDVSGDCNDTLATACDVDAQAAATYVETIPSTTCSGSGTTFQCNLGQMKDGDPAKSFVLIFKAPALADADHWAAGASIKLKWTLDYGSGGSSGSASSIFCNGAPCSSVASTNLITTDTTAILSSLTSYIPSAGGTFFTGISVSALSTSTAATSTTKLVVPDGENLSTAANLHKTHIEQTIDTNGGLTADTTTTITTLVQVPNNEVLFTKFVTIELRRDVSTIKKGAKVANAKIYYAHDDVAFGSNEVQLCPVGGPSTLTPVCLASPPTEFSKKAPAADAGDWLFVIHALENGGFKF